jgi:hypothetical protein
MRSLADIEWRDVRLRPTETLLNDADDDVLQRVIRVGTIDVLDAADLSAGGFDGLAKAERQLVDLYDFAVVRVPLTIHPRDKLRVRFLAVEGRLGSSEGPADCYSLAPERVDQEIKAKSVAKLSAKLKLLTADAGRDNEYVIYQPSIVAYGIGQSDPSWEFRPVRGRELQGIQLLHLLVRVRRGESGVGAIFIRADVVLRRLLRNVEAVGDNDRREIASFSWPP